MVKIFVLGATGYIGFRFCQSLRRDAHTVYGLARTAEKARVLAQHEIIPVLGTVESGEYLSVIRKENVDIVVNASGAHRDAGKIIEDLKHLSEERLERRGKTSPRLGYLYVGGTWVHGDAGSSTVNDLNPVAVGGDPACPAQPEAMVAWRPPVEEALLDAKDVLDVVIVRPGVVFGGSGRIWSLWFHPIFDAVTQARESVEIAAKENTSPALIHVDDVAAAMHLLVNKFELVSSASGVYPVFNLSACNESVKDILEGAAATLGFKGKLTFRGANPDNVFERAMNVSQKIDCSRARDLLGWTPKHTSVLAEIETIVQAWKAHE